MKNSLSHLDQYKIEHPLIKVFSKYEAMGDEKNCMIRIPSKTRNTNIIVIFSSGGGWEHASVSLENKKMPCWDELCFVKDLFWDESETVVQFHPKKTDHVNIMTTCLHLWKKVGEEYELPKRFMV
jgi:hypothetical protein